MNSRQNTGRPTPNKAEGLEKETANQFPLGKKNFKWMIVSAALIVVGFLLMLGGSSTEEFNPDIFSTRRIVIGPTIAFIGFVAMGVSIIIKPDSKKENSKKESKTSSEEK